MTRKIFLSAGMQLLLAVSFAFSQTVWQKYEGNPVLAPTESWEAAYGVIGPRVLKIGGLYKMWYNGLDFRRQIGLATSADGIHWTKSGANPVLSNGQPGDFDSEHVHYGPVLFHDDQYWFWYSGHNGQHWQIGLAISEDGIHWAKHPDNPALTVGSNGEWDAYGVISPAVIFDGHSYKMWYNGNGPEFVLAAGYAESSDGVHWTKYPHNPILTPVPNTWESDAVGMGPVLFFEGKYHAWYGGRQSGIRSSIGYATSADGITWERFAGNPAVEPGKNDAWDSTTLGGFWVLRENDVLKMWYSGRRDDIWKIGYAVSAPKPPTGARGRIVVSHDVNTLSSQYGGPQEQQFAVNVAKFLIGANSGNILAIESNPDDMKRNYSPDVKDALTSAGYNVTYSNTPDYTLTELLAYDAVFVGIIWPPPYTVIDNFVLTDYVNHGGNVYIFSGVGSEPDSTREAALLNPFLKNFGIMFDASRYNQIRNRSINITSHHPIFDGVTELRADNGQSIIDLGTDSRAQIVQFEENQGVYAVFDPSTERLFFLPRVDGLPGDTINVTLYADPIGGISGGDVVIGFDPEVLAVTSVATTDFTKHFLLAANLDTPGLARISLAGAEGAAGDLGGVITLRMIVNPALSIPDTAFSRPLQLQMASFYDQNGQLLPAAKRDGEFVLGKSRGDVNGDGFVNAADAILTLRIAAGLLDPTPEQFAEADVDANGHVESFDASCILRRAVGLPCPLGGNAGVAATLTVLPFSTSAGNLVETKISVEGIEKLLSGDMTLRFVTTALEITEIRPSPEMSAGAFISNLSAGGQARISFAATEAIAAKTIAVVRLRAKISVNERDLRAIEGIFFDDQGRRWNSVVTGVHSPDESGLPSTFHLAQNHPNPFYGGRAVASSSSRDLITTQIRYALPHGAHVKLIVYDIHGRQVRVLEDAEKAAGEYVQAWDGKDERGATVASGVYVYRLLAGKSALAGKMLLLE